MSLKDICVLSDVNADKSAKTKYDQMSSSTVLFTNETG